MGSVGADWVEQTFVLPYPPSTNNLFATSIKTGRRHTTGRYAAWRKEAGWKLKSQNPQPMTGRVHAEIIAIRPDNRRRDLDNLVKAVNDLLVEHGVLEDDCLIERATQAWSSADLTGISVTVTGALKKTQTKLKGT